jgi:hypothetical protein
VICGYPDTRRLARIDKQERPFGTMGGFLVRETLR